MSLVVQINQNKILLPKDSHDQDKFIGKWHKAQTMAIAKVQDEWLFKDYTSEPGTTMAGFNTATMRATLAGDFEANNIVVDSGSFENVTSNNATITNSTISDTVIDCGTF